MIAVPEKIQLQISEALSVIAEYDFPHKWDSLLPVGDCKDYVSKPCLHIFLHDIRATAIGRQIKSHGLYCEQRCTPNGTFHFQAVCIRRNVRPRLWILV